MKLENFGGDLRLRWARAMRTEIAMDVEEEEAGKRFDGLFMPTRRRCRYAGREGRRGERGQLGFDV